MAVSGFAVGGDAMASAKVDSNVLIGLQGCKDHLKHLKRLGIQWENPKENPETEDEIQVQRVWQI